jgi:hypothetical protein
MIYKTLYRKLKFEQHKPHTKHIASEWSAAPSPLMTPTCRKSLTNLSHNVVSSRKKEGKLLRKNKNRKSNHLLGVNDISNYRTLRHGKLTI